MRLNGATMASNRRSALSFSSVGLESRRLSTTRYKQHGPQDLKHSRQVTVSLLTQDCHLEATLHEAAHGIQVGATAHRNVIVNGDTLITAVASTAPPDSRPLQGRPPDMHTCGTQSSPQALGLGCTPLHLRNGTAVG